MTLSRDDVRVMVDMADALHWLFFGILAQHPHDATYKYLFPFFKQVQDGLTQLAQGNDPLDANVDDLFARIKAALAESKSAEPVVKAAKRKAKSAKPKVKAAKRKTQPA